jgi:hypothetical protein
MHKKRKHIVLYWINVPLRMGHSAEFWILACYTLFFLSVAYFESTAQTFAILLL